MISIIIPAFNSEAFLDKCIASVLSQTVKELEIICINDCSTDNTLLRMKSWAEKDQRIMIIDNKSNLGISASRNNGIEAAHGEWLMFVDSDDWIDTRTCEFALEKASLLQADMIMWCYTREFKDISRPKLFFKEEKTWEKDIKDLQRRMFGPYRKELRQPDQLDSWGTIWGKLYKRDIVTAEPATRFVDTRIVGTAEDVIFNIDYLQKAKKAVYTPLPFYHYRKTISSYTNLHRDGLAEKWDKLYWEMRKRVLAYNLGHDVEEALQNRIAIGVLGLGLIAMRGKRKWSRKHKEVSQILHRDNQEKALQQLKVQYLKPHWKFFFWTAKHHLTNTFMLLLLAIEKIITKNRL